MAKDAAGADSPKPRPDGANRRRSADPVYGAIDLGTTNCRMLLACKTQHGFRVVDAYSRIVRLGEGLLSTGQLSEPAMTRALEALSVCADRVKRRNVTRLRAIATEACRVATNGPEFLARAKEMTGLDLEIITAEEEARLAVQGSLDLLDPAYDAAVVIDIGGGSTELCWVDLAEWRARGALQSGGRPPLRGWSTMPLGVVTLSDRFPEPADPEQRAAWYQAMKDCATEHLRPPKGARRLRPLFESGRAHIVGTSGTVTSVAGVHLNLEKYVRDRVDGMWMSTADARIACQRLAGQSRADRAREGCIGDDRADLVVSGCAIYEAVMDAWPTERVRVGDRGLREGILLGLMRPRRRRGARGRSGSRKGNTSS